MRLSLRALLIAACVSSPISAQHVIETPKETIEIVGLRRWTIQMIDDSLAKYSPQDKLTAHACAAILRFKLHFADASVSVYTGMTKAQTKPYVAVTVVEPSDSALIHYKADFKDSLPVRAEWAEAIAQFKAANELAQTAIQTPSFYAATLSPKDSIRFEKVRAIHDLVATHHSGSEFELARHTLDMDGNSSNRAMALLVLSSFVDRDSAWWVVTDALRDPSGGMVNATASQVLRMMAERSPRSVDWAPIADRLRYVIDGTNLFAFNGLLNVLTSTSISPSLAPALLANGGTILSAKLRSGDGAAKQAARGFLAQLSGLPSTNDSKLEAWLRQTTAVR